MKLYKHYKQKYYKLYGIAKHSETLTDVAYYECLYKNPAGQFWVRPTELFFGTTEIEGQQVPRFQEVELTLHQPDYLKAENRGELKPFFDSIFSDDDARTALNSIPEDKPLLAIRATCENQFVGLCLGFEDSPHVFQQSLIAIAPTFQRLGIAHSLLGTQLAWCLKNGYSRLKTSLPNHLTSALHFYLSHEFLIVGTELDSRTNKTHVILERKLR